MADKKKGLTIVEKYDVVKAMLNGTYKGEVSVADMVAFIDGGSRSRGTVSLFPDNPGSLLQDMTTDSITLKVNAADINLDMMPFFFINLCFLLQFHHPPIYLQMS